MPDGNGYWIFLHGPEAEGLGTGENDAVPEVDAMDELVEETGEDICSVELRLLAEVVYSTEVGVETVPGLVEGIEE